MIKVLNLLMPFLMEMLFGKKEDIEKLDAKTRFKRWVFLSLIVLSVVVNYYAIEKIATISVKYIALKKEKKSLEAQLATVSAEVARAHNIETILQGCLRTDVAKKK